MAAKFMNGSDCQKTAVLFSEQADMMTHRYLNHNCMQPV